MLWPENIPDVSGRSCHSRTSSDNVQRLVGAFSCLVWDPSFSVVVTLGCVGKEDEGNLGVTKQSI